ncbi:hypothetical protein [Massilia genomosp. 1]|nr:hypothetical protein [Massilia genomosp. 1]
MAVFIENYVAAPIKQISTFDGQLLPFGAQLVGQGNIELRIGAHTCLIRRHEDPALAEDEEQ